MKVPSLSYNFKKQLWEINAQITNRHFTSRFCHYCKQIIAEVVRSMFKIEDINDQKSKMITAEHMYNPSIFYDPNLNAFLEEE